MDRRDRGTHLVVVLLISAIVGTSCSSGGEPSADSTSAGDETQIPATSTSDTADLLASAEPVGLFEDAFDSDVFVFWTGSDSDMRSEVRDGVLRFEIVDTTQTQTLRNVLPETVDGVRFEATVTLMSHHIGGLGMGCWSGDRSYLAMVTGDRFIGVWEVRSEPVGSGRRHRLRPTPNGRSAGRSPRIENSPKTVFDNPVGCGNLFNAVCVPLGPVSP